MTKVSCEIEDGLMPSEKIARVIAADGEVEEISVSSSNISDNKLMASEILRHEGKVLVELPRESASGKWRIWVSENLVVSEVAATA